MREAGRNGRRRARAPFVGQGADEVLTERTASADGKLIADPESGVQSEDRAEGTTGYPRAKSPDTPSWLPPSLFCLSYFVPKQELHTVKCADFKSTAGYDITHVCPL